MADYDVTIIRQGFRQGAYDIKASATRDIVTADVLEYDGLLSNYALIWKKITINHSQSTDIIGVAPPSERGYTNSPFGDLSPEGIPYNVTSIHRSSSKRDVEFYLTYKVSGEKVDKKICSCTMTKTYDRYGSDVTASESFEGQRVWGCSIQVSGGFIAYQYKIEEVISGDPGVMGDGYDGNHAFECWVTDREDNDLWRLKSHIVGLININDGFGSTPGYLCEKEYQAYAPGAPMLGTDIYSVGVVTPAT